MRLLLDSVPVGSPGGLRLRDEIAGALVTTCPAGDEIVLASVDSSTTPALHTIRCSSIGTRWDRRAWWYGVQLPRLLRERRADAVYSLGGIVSRQMHAQAATIVSINNMVPFTPELLASRPWWSRAGLRYRLLRRAYVQSAKRADAIVLHSPYALSRLAGAHPAARHKTTVVLTGVPSDLQFDLDAPGSHPHGGRPYFFYLSALYRYKNHSRLLEAYAAALAERPELPDLLIAGLPADASYTEEVRRQIARLALGTRIQYLGSVERSSIPAWLHHATANVFPSTCETNSVVLAEVLGVGGALAAANIDSIQEVVQDAALLFDPFSVESITRSLVTLASDGALREDLRRRARRRAGDLSWQQVGLEIWNAAHQARARYDLRIG